MREIPDSQTRHTCTAWHGHQNGMAASSIPSILPFPRAYVPTSPSPLPHAPPPTPSKANQPPKQPTHRSPSNQALRFVLFFCRKATLLMVRTSQPTSVSIWRASQSLPRSAGGKKAREVKSNEVWILTTRGRTQPRHRVGVQCEPKRHHSCCQAGHVNMSKKRGGVCAVAVAGGWRLVSEP